MSDKLKPNFTPIPNTILDEIMGGLNESELKTLLAICRFTYGWGKKSDRISLKQLSEITGIGDRSNVHRAIKGLGNLLVVAPGDPSKNLASEYRINFDITDDLLSEKQQELLSEKQQPVVRPVVSSATFQRKIQRKKNTGAKAPESSSNKRSLKLTRPDPATLAAFEKFYAAYPRRVGRKPALKAWLKLSPSPELVTAIMAGVERYADSVADVDPTYIKHPGPWLNDRRWEDEPVGTSGINGHNKSVDVKDLGDGFVEVDGRRMDKRTAERRGFNAAT